MGILYVIAALAVIYGALDDDNTTAYIIMGVGSLIAAILYLLFGNKVRTNAISGKLNVLGNYVRIVGVVSVVSGLFVVIAGFFFNDTGDLTGSAIIGTGVFSIILGLIIMWASGKILDGKETTFDKILWIILVVVFILMLIGEIMSLLTDPIDAICGIIISVFMLAYLFDPEVKKAMNM
ncbi:MAG: hypothetical protein Q4Q58_00725 [Thermoplasmata archaeon]|nr:hypothetical protein [Thermoplasmata archaeon]